MGTHPLRSRVVVLNGHHEVALISRHTANADYYTLPGGGIEKGEEDYEAAVREVQEELGLAVRLEDFLGMAGKQSVFLARVENRPSLTLSGPELAKASEDNTYTPLWVPLEQLVSLRVHSRDVKSMLLHYLPRWLPAVALSH